METLIRAGAAVDTAADNGYTPLHWAALGRHLNVVRLLLEYGADAEAEDNKGRTLLDIAISKTDDEMAALLRRKSR